MIPLVRCRRNTRPSLSYFCNPLYGDPCSRYSFSPCLALCSMALFLSLVFFRTAAYLPNGVSLTLTVASHRSTCSLSLGENETPRRLSFVHSIPSSMRSTSVLIALELLPSPPFPPAFPELFCLVIFKQRRRPKTTGTMISGKEILSWTSAHQSAIKYNASSVTPSMKTCVLR